MTYEYQLFLFSPLPAGWLLVAAYVSCRSPLFDLFISAPLNLIRVLRGALCDCDCLGGPLEALRSRPSATLNPANPLNLSPPLSNCDHYPESPHCWVHPHFNLSGPSVFFSYTFFCCSFHFRWPSWRSSDSFSSGLGLPKHSPSHRPQVKVPTTHTHTWDIPSSATVTGHCAHHLIPPPPP